MRICLQKTDLRPYLTQKLQRALETRLLHPGVNTPDVLTAYVAAIRALRQLDPTGVLLETVTQPVRCLVLLIIIIYNVIKRDWAYYVLVTNQGMLLSHLFSNICCLYGV